MRTLLVTLLAALALAAPAAAAAQESQITAKGAILIDANTGRVLYKKNPDGRLPIASTTKLMTVLLTLENAKLSDVVVTPRYHGVPAESLMGFRAGERITVADLVRAALIQSANDAAEALAEHVGGDRASFVRMMNRRAVQLGLSNTHYGNPIGLDEADNYSSARDLVKLTLVLRRNSFFRRTVRQPSITLESGAHPRTFKNRNGLVSEHSWIDGVKTGHTNLAGGVLVASARRLGVPLVSAVIGSASNTYRNTDTMTLLRFGYSKYVLRQAVGRGQVLGHVPIRFRPGAELNLVAVRTVHRGVLRGTHFERRPVGLPAEVDGPVEAGTKLGRVDVIAHEPHAKSRLITSVSLEAANDVPAASAARKVQEEVTRPWTLVVLIVAVALVAILVRRPMTTRNGTRKGGPAEPMASPQGEAR